MWKEPYTWCRLSDGSDADVSGCRYVVRYEDGLEVEFEDASSTLTDAEIRTKAAAATAWREVASGG